MDQKVHMVMVGTYFDECDLVAITYLETNAFQNTFYVRVDYRATVLRRTNQMIQKQRYVVTLPDVFAHNNLE